MCEGGPDGGMGAAGGGGGDSMFEADIDPIRNTTIEISTTAPRRTERTFIMGIQGLLRNLHPILVPPPNHHSRHKGDDGDGGDRPEQQQQRQRQHGRRRRRGGTDTTTDNGTAVRHNVRQFAGRSLAIDASSWLHRAAYACAERIVESTESNVRDPIAEGCYTNYILDRCRELLSNAGITRIYLVFDGTRVPLKGDTNAIREDRRRTSLEEARDLKRRGLHREASERYLRCVRGTETMARVVCNAVERRWGKHRPDRDGDDDGDGDVRVRCVWSPYEADAQLAKLCVDGLAHAVVTEDSDVLVYSAVTRVPFPIIYKLDRKDGSCDVITMDWLLNAKFAPYSHGGVGGGGVVDCGHDDDDDEYDDMGFAPVRRSLPPPPAAMSGGRRTGGGSGGGKGEHAVAADGALLAVLRAFANRERSDPGAGVRLFVQACVLSGCDYAPNRLSKVGPVTAFRLTREASHREPGARFGRILASLPAGSRIVNEPTSSGDGDSGDGDADEGPGGEEDENENGNFPSPPDADRDMKGKYEELLLKSEAVFYYHLVRELSTGNIVPLVSHYRSSGGNGSTSPDPNEKFRPCVDGLDAGLTFVGSTTEAMTNESKPLPALLAGGDSLERHHRLENAGWMSTNRHSGGIGQGRVHFQPRKTSTAVPTLSKEQPKETPMQKYLRGTMPKKSTGARALRDNHNSSNTTNTVKSVGCVDRKNDTAKGRSPQQIPIAHVDPVDAAAASVPGWTNPFSSYTYGCATTETVQAKEKSPIAPLSVSAMGRSVMKSPFFSSPVKFDYNCEGSSPLVDVFEPKSRIDADTTDFAVATSEAFAPLKDVPLGSLDDDDNGESEKRTRQSVVNNGTIGNGASFDYGIILESPPRKASPVRDGILCKFIDRALSSDNEQLEPRRVSTSPPEVFRSDVFHNGNSPEDGIDLADDDDDDEAESFPAASSTVKENISNCGRLNVQNGTMSSVISRKFKSPYPVTIPNRMTTSSSHGKTRPTTSSSALLAGFARQEKMRPASYSSRISGTKRKSKPNFFPTNSANVGSESLKKSMWSERWGFGASV
ncbi:hypothetical protein ACHAXA_007689 [Cyclostephanos tholiformis]|uniref:Exonuclease 1 n=1 Tax=Cyclostephanos tholiformis TaxID=382380 RepID=A0ABD3SDI7_9STRA